MKKILSLLICLFISAISAQAQYRTYSFYYKSDAWKLTKTQEKILDSLLKNTGPAQNIQISLDGHTDSVGKADYNLALSTRRTGVILAWLKAKSYDINRIKIQNLGETMPYSGDGGVGNLAMNRRVDVSIGKPAVLTEGNTKSTPNINLPDTNQKYTTIQDLYNLLTQKAQEFTIDNTKDTILTCKDGTLLYVRANTFKLNDNCRDGKITLTVKEATRLGSMILENATTRAADSLLQTAGMVQVLARSCGNEVVLKDGEHIGAFIPQRMRQEDMQVFYADRDSSSHLDWQLANPQPLDKFIPAGSWARNPYNGGGGFGGCMRRRHFIFYGLYCYLFGNHRNYTNVNKKNFSRRNEALTTYNSLSAISKSNIASVSALEKVYGYYAMSMAQKAKIDMDYQVMQVKTGWNNCDKFYNAGPNEAVRVALDTKSDKMTDVMLIYPNENVVDYAVSKRGYFVFPKVYSQREVILLGLRYNKGVAFLASKKVKVTPDADYSLDFKEISVLDLKNTLATEYNFR